MPDKRKAVSAIMDKLRTALDALKKRVPKGNLPRLEALRVYINKMKPKDPNAPRKINYHGGVFKLAPLVKTARQTPPYQTSKDPERKRMRKAWEEGVQGVSRRGR